jgi:cell wall-associated NlpC family hydrolase
MPRPRALAGLVVAAGVLAGCVAPRPYMARRRAVPVPAHLILWAARSQLGRDYAYGGDSPRTGFDCSGLVYWCYRRYGSYLPRTVRGQYDVGVPVPKRDLRAGDLVFFATGSGPPPSHVGIMLNHDRFIHSPASGQTVREDDLTNNYWRRTYYGARRIE